MLHRSMNELRIEIQGSDKGVEDMARLTEREVDLIRQARANSPLGEWVNAQKLIEEAHRLRAAYMADKTRKGLEIITRTTGP